MAISLVTSLIAVLVTMLISMKIEMRTLRENNEMTLQLKQDRIDGLEKDLRHERQRSTSALRSIRCALIRRRASSGDVEEFKQEDQTPNRSPKEMHPRSVKAVRSLDEQLFNDEIDIDDYAITLSNLITSEIPAE